MMLAPVWANTEALGTSRNIVGSRYGVAAYSVLESFWRRGGDSLRGHCGGPHEIRGLRYKPAIHAALSVFLTFPVYPSFSPESPYTARNGISWYQFTGAGESGFLCLPLR